MIDHMLVPNSMLDLFTSCAIMCDHDLNSSDHLPIIAHLSVKPLCFKRYSFKRIKYNWSKLSVQDIHKTYGRDLDVLLSKIKRPNNIDDIYALTITIMQSFVACRLHQKTTSQNARLKSTSNRGGLQTLLRSTQP